MQLTSSAAAESWNRIAAFLGCGSSALVECMRSKRMAELLAAMANTTVEFGLTVDEQTVFFFCIMALVLLWGGL